MSGNSTGPTYAETGTEISTGTKLFCVCGHVERPGVYEVPFGTTLRELYDLAGGVAGDRELQTILMGGAAGPKTTGVHPDFPLTLDLRRTG